MTRVPYETTFLREWIRCVAEGPVKTAAPPDRPPQTTYERTFRWHLGVGDRPNLFLFRHSESGASGDRDDEQLTTYDAVLIDGHHGYEWVRHDLAARGACVRSGGVILVHRTRRGFDRALLAIHAWASDTGASTRWPHEGSLAIAKAFEDLRAAAFEGAPWSVDPSTRDLRDLREDFEHEAAYDGLIRPAVPAHALAAKAAG